MPNIPKCPQCGTSNWTRESDVIERDELDPETGIFMPSYSENHEQSIFCTDCERYLYQFDNSDELEEAFEKLSEDNFQDWRADLKFLIERLSYTRDAKWWAAFHPPNFHNDVQQFIDEIQSIYDNSGTDEKSPP